MIEANTTFTCDSAAAERHKHRISAFAIVTWAYLLILVLSMTTFLLYGSSLVEAVYRQQSIGILNRLIKNPDGGPVDYYNHKANVYFTRSLLLMTGTYLFIVAALRRRRMFRSMLSFLSTPDYAINLAVVRVVLFSALLAEFDSATTEWYAALPKELVVPPWGLARVLDIIPIHPQAVQITSTVFFVACVGGLLGLFSRVSAFTAALSGLYVLGVPQCFGKVNHYHHEIWFLLILAVSRCGDALSLDSLVRGRFRSRQTAVPLDPSVAYGFPLRIIWLLFGIVYFFPGFWKAWNCGLEWGYAENLKLIMYNKWFELGHWTPPLRIDLYPHILTLFGLATIGFEMGFLFLLFHPRTRLLAVLAGLSFHSGTNFFMRIDFLDLQCL